MNLSTYIIDDERHAIDVLESYIKRTPGLALPESFTNPMKALETLAGLQAPKIVFLDINMPELSGIELAGLINSENTAIVFTTSYRDFGPEAYEKKALGYLLKPISYGRFLATVQTVRDQLALEKQKDKERFSFFVKGDEKGKLIRINPAEILYLEASDNYIKIHTATEVTMTYLTLQETLKQLSPEDFIQVHRSYVIQLGKVKAIERDMIRLENQKLVPLGENFRETFFLRIQDSVLISHRERKA